MQTAGMLRGTRAIYFIALQIILIGTAHSYPLQILPSIPGHVPVYIRHGDESLDHIHPGLAEAFHEPPSSKSIRLEDFPSPEQINFEEATRFLARYNKKIIFPAYPRDPEASTIGSLNDLNNEAKKSDKVPSIDEVHEEEENNAEKHHGHSKRNPPSLRKEALTKLSPISDTERENLEKALQLAKKEISVSNRDTNLNEDTSRQDQENKERKESNSDKEEPVKLRNPEDILGNVQKLSPISLEGNKDSADIAMDTGLSSNQEEPMNIHILPTISVKEEKPESSESKDSPTDEQLPVKTSHPEHVLANVDKLLPALEGQTKSEANTPIVSANVGTHDKAPANVLGTVSIFEENSSKKEEESPVKIEPSENPGKVLKVSSISGASIKTESSEGGTSSSVNAEKKEKPKEESTHNSKDDSNSEHNEPPIKLSIDLGIPTNVLKVLGPKETVKKIENDKMEDLTKDEIAMD